MSHYPVLQVAKDVGKHFLSSQIAYNRGKINKAVMELLRKKTARTYVKLLIRKQVELFGIFTFKTSLCSYFPLKRRQWATNFPLSHASTFH